MNETCIPQDSSLNEFQSILEKSEFTSRIEILKEYTIEIKFLSIGCIVRVGCREIAFENIEEAMEEIKNYVKNPNEERRKWNKKFNQ